jgi:hypothetical protein
MMPWNKAERRDRPSGERPTLWHQAASRPAKLRMWADWRMRYAIIPTVAAAKSRMLLPIANDFYRFYKLTA